MGSQVTYGAKRYSTVSAALASLRADLPSKLGGSGELTLGSGVVGIEYKPTQCLSAQGCGDAIDWHLGRWEMMADYSSCPANVAKTHLVPDAKTMVALRGSHPLPAAPGVVYYSNACGDSTSVGASATWAQGADVYSTSAFGAPNLPMLMAAAMRPY